MQISFTVFTVYSVHSSQLVATSQVVAGDNLTSCSSGHLTVIGAHSAPVNGVSPPTTQTHPKPSCLTRYFRALAATCLCSPIVEVKHCFRCNGHAPHKVLFGCHGEKSEENEKSEKNSIVKIPMSRTLYVLFVRMCVCASHSKCWSLTFSAVTAV